MNNVSPNIYCADDEDFKLNDEEVEVINEVIAAENRATFFGRGMGEYRFMFESPKDGICPICKSHLDEGIMVRETARDGYKTIVYSEVCPTCLEMVADILRNVSVAQKTRKAIIKKRLNGAFNEDDDYRARMIDSLIP